MGTFIYGSAAHVVEIEDRTLVHLRIVVMNKLRRSEPFMLDLEMNDGSGRRSYWVHPHVPLQFRLHGHGRHPINPRWIDALMASASGPGGMTLVMEPVDAA